MAERNKKSESVNSPFTISLQWELRDQPDRRAMNSLLSLELYY